MTQVKKKKNDPGCANCFARRETWRRGPQAKSSTGFHFWFVRKHPKSSFSIWHLAQKLYVFIPFFVQVVKELVTQGGPKSLYRCFFFSHIWMSGKLDSEHISVALALFSLLFLVCQRDLISQRYVMFFVTCCQRTKLSDLRGYLSCPFVPNQ